MPGFPRRSLTALAAAAIRPAAAQISPAAIPGSIRIIVPYNPGGITDILARALAQQMTVQLGQSVVVENRAGANGSIGATVAARSPAALDLIREGINGTVREPDAQALGEGLLDVLLPGRLGAFQAAARASAEQYALPVRARALEELYWEVLSRRRSPQHEWPRLH